MKIAKLAKNNVNTRDGYVSVPVSWPVDVERVVAVIPTYVCSDISDRIVISDWSSDNITIRAGASQSVDLSMSVLYV